MLVDRILTINLVASTALFFVAARLYVLPNVHGWGFRGIMPPILLLHSFRHLGLAAMAGGNKCVNLRQCSRRLVSPHDAPISFFT